MTDWIRTIHALMREIGGEPPSIKMTDGKGTAGHPTGYASVGEGGKIVRACKKGDHVVVQDSLKVLTALIPMLEVDGFTAEIKGGVLIVRHKK